jgi:hypothetical protein
MRDSQMPSKRQNFCFLFLSATLVGLGGCARIRSHYASHNHGPQASSSVVATSPSPVTTRITPADLAKLRWIEGSWRGTGDVDTPFYERYRFENESTLLVDSFPDEKLTKVDDTTRFELKDGQFGNAGEGSRWIATAIDDKSITFEPVSKARNSFRWTRESADLWKAVLKWPATGNSPAKERVYRMERWPHTKP